MTYVPRPAPSDPAQLPGYFLQELQNIQNALQAARPSIILSPVYAEPAKKPEGLVVYADGTVWNPGSGAGTYQWRGGAWQPWEGGGGGGGGLTAEQAMDTIAAMLTAGTNITLTYNDAGDTLTIDAAGGSEITAAAAMGV